MERTGASVPIIHADSLEKAVEAAKRQGMQGDIVTLSPGCASFDMFKNFTQRGNRFKELVNNM